MCPLFVQPTHSRAAPHRVLNVTGHNRMSIPFFFDPNFDCVVSPLQDFSFQGEAPCLDSEEERQPFKYGDYILSKVLKVFPGLEKNAVK